MLLRERQSNGIDDPGGRQVADTDGALANEAERIPGVDARSQPRDRREPEGYLAVAAGVARRAVVVDAACDVPVGEARAVLDAVVAGASGNLPRRTCRA